MPVQAMHSRGYHVFTLSVPLSWCLALTCCSGGIIWPHVVWSSLVWLCITIVADYKEHTYQYNSLDDLSQKMCNMCLDYFVFTGVLWCIKLHCESEKNLDLFSLENNFGKYRYCPILIILSLLQTDIFCPHTCNWICHFTYSLLSHYLEKYNHIHFFTELLNKSATHSVFEISLLLQSRKLWWYLLLTVFFNTDSLHHNDVH